MNLLTIVYGNFIKEKYLNNKMIKNQKEIDKFSINLRVT